MSTEKLLEIKIISIHHVLHVLLYIENSSLFTKNIFKNLIKKTSTSIFCHNI
jgi:hypothetical protein